MTANTLDLEKCYEKFKEEALQKNYESTGIWSKYKTDLNETKSLLKMLPKKVSHDVMVPIGPRALMPGKIVHTNEFLVNLGETWFVKRTAFQSIEICDRRIKNCDEMLNKLEKEKEIIMKKTSVPKEHDAFGNEERQEIIEYVTEQENELWKKQHREKEKKYRQQLAELRNKEKKPIKTEEDLWKHLDELELQEELEDELNRLNANYSDEDVEENDSNTATDNENNSEKSNSVAEKTHKKVESKQKRKVSFACDFGESDSDDEPIVVEIIHSDVNPIFNYPNKSIINSPSDIYENYLVSIKKAPTSVLKSNFNPNKEKEIMLMQTFEETESSDEDEEDDKNNVIVSGIHFRDVMEKNVSFKKEPYKQSNKKVSKFKASKRT